MTARRTTCRRWTPAEDDRLRALASDPSLAARAIADRMGRTYSSVRHRLSVLGIPMADRRRVDRAAIANPSGPKWIFDAPLEMEPPDRSSARPQHLPTPRDVYLAALYERCRRRRQRMARGLPPESGEAERPAVERRSRVHRWHGPTREVTQ